MFGSLKDACYIETSYVVSKLLIAFVIALSVTILFFIFQRDYFDVSLAVGNVNVKGERKVAIYGSSGVVTYIAGEGEFVKQGDVIAKLRAVHSINHSNKYLSDNNNKLEHEKKLVENMKSLNSDYHVKNNLLLTQIDFLNQNKDISIKKIEAIKKKITFDKQNQASLRNKDNFIVDSQRFYFLEDNIYQLEASLAEQKSTGFRISSEINGVELQLSNLEYEYLNNLSSLEAELRSVRSEIITDSEFDVISTETGYVVHVTQRENDFYSAESVLVVLRTENAVSDSDSSLEIKVVIGSSKLQQSRVGDKVSIDFPAIPYQQYGRFSGTVNKITNVALQAHEIDGLLFNENEEPSYVVSISMDPNNRNEEYLQLISTGTTANIAFLSNKMSVWQWIMGKIPNGLY